MDHQWGVTHCREPGAGPPPPKQVGQKKDGVEGGREDPGWGSATVAAVTSPAWETKVSMAEPPVSGT